MKLKHFLLSIFALFLFPVSVLAVDPSTFSVRLGQPKSPTNQDNFKLTFVALDTRNDRSITVKCYKKGPSDVDFVQFDENKELIFGGNTDSCAVTNAILNVNGNYLFKIIGSVTTDSEVHSSTVSVDYNTSGPSTPVNYSKERINSCDYKIKFKTADDGKTVKVQIFRSDNLSLNIDNGSVISTVNIGPNTEGEITNSVPVCTKDYYFVIRAVDNSDNVSGTIGDNFTTTTSTTNNPSTGTKPTNGAIVLNGEQKTQVANPASNSGQPTDLTVSPTPAILGASTDTKNNFYKWLLGLVAIFVGYLIIRSVRNTK